MHWHRTSPCLHPPQPTRAQAMAAKHYIHTRSSRALHTCHQPKRHQHRHPSSPVVTRHHPSSPATTRSPDGIIQVPHAATSTPPALLCAEGASGGAPAAFAVWVVAWGGSRMPWMRPKLMVGPLQGGSGGGVGWWMARETYLWNSSAVLKPHALDAPKDDGGVTAGTGGGGRGDVICENASAVFRLRDCHCCWHMMVWCWRD